MAFWLNDIDTLFADFAVPGTLANGVNILGLYDSDYVAVGDVPVDSYGPAFTVKASDVTAQEIAIGSTVTIEAASFIVRSVQPDGTGITVLRLEAA